jgi:hypothetical protein
MTPLVSIVIPVGPDHAAHAAQAVASCVWQGVTNWEAIVVNDTGRDLPLTADPRVTVIDAPPGDGRRSSIARNAGFRHARAPFVVPLDADDYLLPTALAALIRGHAAHEDCYTYGWHYGLNKAGAWGLFRSPDYDRAKLKTFNLHPITALIPAEVVRAVGGCDEGAPGLEDWTLWLRLAQAGCCGRQIYGPVFVYRRDEGVNHIADVDGGLALHDSVRDRHRDATGEITFMGCGCGGQAAEAKALARQAAPLLGRDIAMTQNGLMTLEYTGPGDGAKWFGCPSGKQVRAGRGPAVRYVQVSEEDARHLQALGFFRPVPPPAAFVPPPKGVTGAGTVAESATVTADDAPLETALFETPTEGAASPYPGKGKRKA